MLKFNNKQIYWSFQDDYYPPQTRDHIHINLNDEPTYTEAASVLEPIKPMMYDPYLYDDNIPMTMDVYNNDYYYDYYDDLPDVSALRGPAIYNDLAVPEENIPPLSPAKVPPKVLESYVGVGSVL